MTNRLNMVQIIIGLTTFMIMGYLATFFYGVLNAITIFSVLMNLTILFIFFKQEKERNKK